MTEAYEVTDDQMRNILIGLPDDELIRLLFRISEFVKVHPSKLFNTFNRLVEQAVEAKAV